MSDVVEAVEDSVHIVTVDNHHVGLGLAASAPTTPGAERCVHSGFSGFSGEPGLEVPHSESANRKTADWTKGKGGRNAQEKRYRVGAKG